MIPKKLPPIETVQDVGDYAQRLEKCAKSCSYFAVQFLNLDVFDYNKAFLDCMDRFIVYRTGRQVGKSRNAAIKAIHFGYFAPLFASNLDEGECNVVIASLSKDQAYLIFKKISSYKFYPGKFIIFCQIDSYQLCFLTFSYKIFL